MDLRRLRHFSTLAETLNFRVASERTHLSQPAFTRSIAALERELGVCLFTRDKRHVKLTPDGAELLVAARELIRDGDQFGRTARALRRGGPSELRLGFYGDALAELTDPIMRAFRDRYPDVLLSFSDVSFDRAVEPLLTGDLDLALLRVPSDIPELTTVRLFAEPAAVQLWSEHERATQRTVAIGDLLEDPWNALPQGTPASWVDWWLCTSARQGRPPLVGGHGRTLAEMHALVAYRHLVALAPLSASRALRPGVRTIPARDAPPFNAGIAFGGTTPTPIVERFIETAIAVTRRELGRVASAESLL